MKPVELEMAIQIIQRRKREAGIIPDNALRIADIFKEFRKLPTDEIDAALRALLDAGRIKAGRTVNDTWVRLK